MAHDGTLSAGKPIMDPSDPADSAGGIGGIGGIGGVDNSPANPAGGISGIGGIGGADRRDRRVPKIRRCLWRNDSGGIGGRVWAARRVWSFLRRDRRDRPIQQAESAGRQDRREPATGKLERHTFDSTRHPPIRPKVRAQRVETHETKTMLQNDLLASHFCTG
jgi:hypothetical protein